MNVNDPANCHGVADIAATNLELRNEEVVSRDEVQIFFVFGLLQEVLQLGLDNPFNIKQVERADIAHLGTNGLQMKVKPSVNAAGTGVLEKTVHLDVLGKADLFLLDDFVAQVTDGICF